MAGESKIQHPVEHQRWISSVKVCGVPLGDWANGGYVDDFLHV